MTNEEKSKVLTVVQQRFVDEYLEDPSDGGAAYMRSNPKIKSKKTGSVAASKLLKLPKIQEALKQRAEDILGPVHARILKNVEFWLEIRDGTSHGIGKGKLVALSDIKEAVSDKVFEDIHKLTSYEVVLSSTRDRMKASENMAKYMQMFVEKKEISVEGQVKIVDDIK